MRIELKGLIAGLAAALVVLGGTFGLSAILRSQPDHKGRSPQTMSGTMTAMAQKMPVLTATQMVHGKQLYSQNCASCHGAGAEGAFGPDLRGLDPMDADAMSKVKNGVKGKMPAFGTKLSDPDTQGLVAYLHSLKK
jgi:mono/diheme cytochrome c family protein